MSRTITSFPPERASVSLEIAGPACGRTHDKMSGEYLPYGTRGRPLYLIKQDLAGGTAHRAHRMMDGRERRTHHGGEGDVVEARQGNMIGDMKSVFMERLERTKGHLIARGEDRIGA